MFWGDLRRHEALRFLETVRTDIIAGANHAGEVVALNLPHWLMRHVENAHNEVWIAADVVHLSAPFGASRTWLDVFADLLQRDVKLMLYLKRFAVDRHNPESLSIAQHLRLLIERGLSLHWIDHLPPWQTAIDPDDDAYCRAIRVSTSDAFSLDSETGQSGLFTTILRHDVISARNDMLTIKRREALDTDLMPPAHIQVMNITSDRKKVSEAIMFKDVFALPVRSLTVNDPYLIDSERIINRLGAYVDLANQHGTLEKVTVVTKRAGQRGVQGSASEQDRCFARLEKHFDCEVDGIFDPNRVEHDRSITINRQDGSQARILIGRGLDFIHSDGSVDPTYVVIQDPLGGD